MKHLSRRRFLILSTGIAIVGLSGARWIFTAGRYGSFSLKYLNSREAQTMAAAYAVVVNTESLKDRIEFIDSYVGRLSFRDRLEFKGALFLVEYSPLFFHLFWGRFSRLDQSDRAVCLEGWRDGFKLGRPIYGALRELSFLAQYSDDASWESIGYAGPIVQRTFTPFDQKYTVLLSKENLR